MKNYFGEHRVLNICTFGTEGSRSAILTACRGLGIDNDIAQSLADMIPSSRGMNWSLRDCVYGNEEEGKLPIKEFVNELNQYPRLLEVALSIEGLVNKRSIHASGVYIFPDDYTHYNAMMKAPNGQPVTQFNMEDSDYMGGLKVDLLTVEALDKIRATMTMLLEDGFMEWQGDLRSTYNKYLHPDVLDYENLEMWTLLEKNEIIDVFQFDTSVGQISANKIKPTNLIEMATANSVMRLMSEGAEQPIDTYVKYKNDISLWYKEMRDFGLTEDEIKVLERHLKIVYGVADTQEIVMEMAMDKDIANFTVAEANQLRKGIAKKKKEVLQEVKDLFFKKGLENGTSETMLHYVWDIQIARQLGYSFSKNHTYPYSCIGLQEMNLAYHYPRIYWNTACLTVNAGANEDNASNKGTDYGKIAEAISNIQSKGVVVALPNINEASYGFKPDIKNNRIIFGLKGINGIGDDVVREIIDKRPYASFHDFLQKVFYIPNSTVKQSHIIQLIKAGAFDEVENTISREELMRNFLTLVSEPKTRLTMQNFPSVIKYGLVPEEYALNVRFYNYRKYIFSKKPYKTIYNDKKKVQDQLYLLDDISTDFYMQHFREEDIVEYVGTNIVISKKTFEKEYKEKMAKVDEWIRGKDVLEALNQAQFEEVWDKYAKGSISTWEMDSLSYYYHEHELAHVNKEKYDIVNFFELDEEPQIAGWNTYRGRKTPKFEIYRIAGTVLDRDKMKHTVSLLTTEGVVTIKMYAGAFIHYDRQISKQNPDGTKKVLEKSWFTRGNKLLVAGYKKGKYFKPRVYKDTVYNHTIALIKDIDEGGNLLIQSERTRVD